MTATLPYRGKPGSPGDTAPDTPAVLRAYGAQMAMDPAPWTLLPGDSEATRELAGLLGVKYRQEPQGGFVHSNLVTVLNRHVGLQQSVADTMTGIRRVAQE